MSLPGLARLSFRSKTQHGACGCVEEAENDEAGLECLRPEIRDLVRSRTSVPKRIVLLLKEARSRSDLFDPEIVNFFTQAREKALLAYSNIDFSQKLNFKPIGQHGFEFEGRSGRRMDGVVLSPRSRGSAPLPCLLYLHGGGMFTYSSFDPNKIAFAKLIADKGVVVVCIDFTNSYLPASKGAPVAPFPAGLEDCSDAFVWLSNNASRFGADPNRVSLCGLSGGGNLAAAIVIGALREPKPVLPCSLLLLSPYVGGCLPSAAFPSSYTYDGLTFDSEWLTPLARYAYGIEHFEAQNPLAWPLFACGSDVVGFPPTLFVLSECDPLRDESTAFARTLSNAGVDVVAYEAAGAVHAMEVTYGHVLPEFAHKTADTLAETVQRNYLPRLAHSVPPALWRKIEV